MAGTEGNGERQSLGEMYPLSAANSSRVHRLPVKYICMKYHGKIDVYNCCL